MNNFIDFHINSDSPDTSLDKPRPFNWRRGAGRLSLLLFLLLTAGPLIEAQAQSAPTPTSTPARFGPPTATPARFGSPTATLARFGDDIMDRNGGAATPTPTSTASFGFADATDAQAAAYYNATLTADPNTYPLYPTSVRQATWAAVGATTTAEFLGGGAVTNIESDIAVEVDAAATALALMVSTPNHRIMVSNRCDGPPRSESERQACDTYKALYRERYGNPCRTNAQGEAVCVH